MNIAHTRRKQGIPTGLRGLNAPDTGWCPAPRFRDWLGVNEQKPRKKRLMHSRARTTLEKISFFEAGHDSQWDFIDIMREDAI